MAQTRFEKWLAQQDYGTRANMICGIVKRCSQCTMYDACTEMASQHGDEEETYTEKWNRTCEEYLDEVIEDEG